MARIKDGAQNMQDIRHANESLAAALCASGDLVYEWDLTTDRLTWWGDHSRFLAANSFDLIGTGEALHGRINPEDLPSKLLALSEHYTSRSPFDCEYRVRQADGNFCWVHDKGQAEFSEAGQPVRVRGVLRIVNRRKAYEAHLEHVANFDELTGHFNRIRLREALQQAIVQHQRYGGSGAYMVIDVDKLAVINNGRGYDLGDAVLVGIGQRLERFIRESDTIGRAGGDTYGIVMPHCTEAHMATVAEKILKLFRENPIETPFGPFEVTVSIGGIVFPDQVHSAFEAMNKAETCVQAAKKSGRDCFIAYRASADQQDEHRQSLEIGEQVKDAIHKGCLMFAYQPVVNADTNSVSFYECLLRIQNPDGTLMPAGLFIPVVERLGLTRLVDRRVLEMALQELIEYPEVTLAINVSGYTASDRAWLRTLVALIKDRPQVAKRLIIEITETAAIQDVNEMVRFVTSVRELGARVAIDDFGAGYTSFQHLRAMTVDLVKIDGSYIKNLANSVENRLFVRNLAGLTANFGLTMVAECVESADDAALLKKEGIELLQGYHFGKPSIDRPWQPVGVMSPKPSASLHVLQGEDKATPSGGKRV